MTLKICRVRPLFFFNVVVLVLVSFTTTTAINKCIDKEKHALLSFKAYIRKDPFNRLSTWTQASNDCCEWDGVTCNNHSRVTGLYLPYSYFEGKISHSLLNLSYLNHLDLSGNFFNGTIPVFIGSMTQLRYLDLSGNYFNGTIPVFIGSMTQLRYLDLSANSFYGTIPVFIGSMTQLRYLNLGWNDFSGTIPSELGNLTNLEFLQLTGFNNCTIESLDWLSHLSKLDYLDMDGTSLAKVNNWVNVILSLQNLRDLSFSDCNLSHVTHPYSYSSINSSFSSSIEILFLNDNNLNSSIYHWLFPLTSSNTLKILDLSSNKLDRIPKYLGNICNLTYLYFHNNSMPVKFSDFLKNLTGCASVTLQELDASSSRFTGSLPDDIQSFSLLTALYLSNNQLNGTISEKVFQLPELHTLDVSSNSLKGTISEYIGMTKILNVDFSNNPLEGVPLEAHMLNLSYLTFIDLSSSKQGPHFPKWIQRLKALSRIDLANTRISDTIPEEFWNIWPSQLTYLNLSSNNISGIITDLSSNFAYSTILDLSSNNFYGPIPNVPSSLQELDLSRNKFSGEIFFLCQINYFLFTFLDLSHNSFIGQIPDCLWQFPSLKVLNLEHNNLSGGLPASIKSLTSLEVLNLYNNSFSGDFPPSLKYCTDLSFLDLGANMFSGDVPIWIGEKLSRLYALSLTSNNFFGTIPSQLCQLVYLQVLDLSKNNLHGTIPSCFNNLTTMVQEGFLVEENVHWLPLNGTRRDKYVDHAMIKWQGRVREFGRTLGFMKIINLSSNNLTGKIPDELTDLHQLIALDLSMNNLLGEIPPSIGEMKELQILDLSRNNLSGEIPTNMSLITFLNYLDVSYNNLSGRIPSGTQLQSFDPSRYTGNAGLCGLPLSKYCPGDKELKVPPVIVESEYDEEDTDDLRRLFYIGGGTGFSIGFWMVCIALLSNSCESRTFSHFLNSLENWVYVKVMVFIAKISKT